MNLPNIPFFLCVVVKNVKMKRVRKKEKHTQNKRGTHSASFCNAERHPPNPSGNKYQRILFVARLIITANGRRIHHSFIVLIVIHFEEGVRIVRVRRDIILGRGGWVVDDMVGGVVQRCIHAGSVRHYALVRFDSLLGDQAILEVHFHCSEFMLTVSKHATAFVGARACHVVVTADLVLEALGEDVAFNGDVVGVVENSFSGHFDVFLVC